MQLSHHSDYFVPLPDGHPFPMGKYTILREILLDRAVAREADLVASEPIDLELLRSVHTDGYLAKLQHGSLTAAEQRRIGVPWSAALWRRSRLAAQGTLNAARNALRAGMSGNLAGGTHHAFADRGEGFCVLNDVAVAIRVLQREQRVQSALIVDLDVHQGNGTAAIFEHDPDVFTFSVHGERNYPSDKMRSSLDIGLADGTDDDTYLRCLELHLPEVLRQHRADVVFYLAGVDVAAGDRYGRFALSDDGIRARERYVIEQVRAAQLPLVITLAGGYAPTAQRTAELHALVFEEAARIESASSQ